MRRISRVILECLPMTIMLGYLLTDCPRTEGTELDCYLSRLDKFALSLSFVSSCANLGIFIATLPFRARKTTGGICTYIAHSLRVAQWQSFA